MTRRVCPQHHTRYCPEECTYWERIGEAMKDDREGGW